LSFETTQPWAGFVLNAGSCDLISFFKHQSNRQTEKRGKFNFLRRFFSLSAARVWSQSREKENFRLSKKILLPSGRPRLEQEPGKGEFSAFEENSSPFRPSKTGARAGKRRIFGFKRRFFSLPGGQG